MRSRLVEILLTGDALPPFQLADDLLHLLPPASLLRPPPALSQLCASSSMSIAAGGPSAMFVPHSFSATQSSIRSSTARLADVASRQEHSHPAGGAPANSYGRSASAGALITDHSKQSISPRSPVGPSALSMMLASQGTSPPEPKDIVSPRQKAAGQDDTDEVSPSTSVTPRASRFDLPSALESAPTPRPNFYSGGLGNASDTGVSTAVQSPHIPAEPRDDDERTPLLTVSAPAEASPPDAPKHADASAAKKHHFLSSLTQRLPSVELRRPTGKEVFQHVVVNPVAALPAVVLGLLLNVLDGVSYDESCSPALHPRSLRSETDMQVGPARMIMFPSNDIFPDFGTPGVAMFFMSCASLAPLLSSRPRTLTALRAPPRPLQASSRS